MSKDYEEFMEKSITKSAYLVNEETQVTIDIINSLDLLNNEGIMCTDDVIMESKFLKSKYVSNEGFFTLKHIEDHGLIRNYYLIKRIRIDNAITKKYISVSAFKKNSKFITKKNI